jgi:hypothetical protein
MQAAQPATDPPGRRWTAAARQTAARKRRYRIEADAAATAPTQIYVYADFALKEPALAARPRPTSAPDATGSWTNCSSSWNRCVMPSFHSHATAACGSRASP